MIEIGENRFTDEERPLDDQLPPAIEEGDFSCLSPNEHALSERRAWPKKQARLRIGALAAEPDALGSDVGPTRNVKRKIIDKQKKFIIETRQKPQKVYLTIKEEAELCELTRADAGELVEQILLFGPRNTFRDKGNMILGLEIVWDAEEFKVE